MSLFVDAVKADHIDDGPVVLLGIDIAAERALYIAKNGSLHVCHISTLSLDADWAPAPIEGDEDVDERS